MQAEETLKDLLSKMIYGTRGGAALATDFTPFTTLIDSTAAAGGITPAAAPAPENQWRSPTWNATAKTGVDATGVAITMPGAALDRAVRRPEVETGAAADVHAGVRRWLRSRRRDLRRGWLVRGLRGVADPAGPLHRHVQGEPRVPNLMFKNVPLYWDPDCPTGTALGLNSKYVGMTLHSRPQLHAVPVHVEPVGLGRLDRQPEPRCFGCRPGCQRHRRSGQLHHDLRQHDHPSAAAQLQDHRRFIQLS